MSKSPEIDAYIADAADFARPILEKVRRLFHKACPEIEEEIKWRFPHFVHKGIVAGMAAFKNHVGVGFWKEKLIPELHGKFTGTGNQSFSAMKFTDVSELPSDKVLLAAIKRAVKLNEDDVKLPKRPPKPKVELVVPDDLAAVLKKHAKARTTWDDLSYSCRREYIQYVTEAKRPETRQKRLEQSLDNLLHGRKHNWQYMKPCS
jgi:uncharacterized protein YdeI (YjbR/CyaY-like superfamily)